MIKNLFWIIILSYLIGYCHAQYEDCERPPKVDYAFPQMHPDANEEYVIAEYTCEPGYIIKGTSKIRCHIDSDEWVDKPPTCEQVEEVTTSENELPTATDGGDIEDDDITTSHMDTEQKPDESDDTKEKRKAGHKIVEDGIITEEFAKHLDMSCHQRRIKAPSIPDGAVVKYERRKSAGHVFLVALYACKEGFKLEDLQNNARYCSNGRWVEFPGVPTCIPVNEEYDEEYDDENTNEKEKEIGNDKKTESPESSPDEYHYENNSNRNENETTFPQNQNVNENLQIIRNETEPSIYSETCGHDRGGCDHICRLLLYPNENEPKPECSCYKGFTLDSTDRKRCHDIDECQINNGGCEQICINIPGDYECSCESGLQIDSVNRTKCVDINECLLRNGHGPCQDTCHNTWGNYTCSCDNLPGTQLSSDGHTCHDSGECLNKNNGGCSHKCLTTMGRIFCLCPDGYDLLDDWKTCKDIDECQYSEIQSQCPYGCENLPGSYRCRNETSNQQMTSFDNENEIKEDNEQVKTLYKIEDDLITDDNDGQIECPEKYRKNDDGHCVDIDECAEGLTGCQYCINKLGGFECTCPTGYELADDERTCRDIDECKMYSKGDNNQYDNNQALYAVCSHECVNLEGSFQCKCPENFHLEYDKRTCARDYCEHLDNPEFNKTKCSHECVDESNGFVCKCPVGYALDTDFKTCLIVDECARNDGHRLCHPGKCTSIGGHYVCECPSGYLEKEGRCHDIDECLLGISGCSHNCLNKEGSFECHCPDGYYLSEDNNKQCVDIDECQIQPDYCGTSMICVNTPGNYKCECPGGQEFQPDGKCGFTDACAANNGYCSHNCVSQNGYAECACPSGWSLSDDGKTCIQQNPCLYNNGGCNQICDPNISGLCACNEGYELSSDGKMCNDRDECKINNGGCDHICVNQPGWYECLCNEGFKLFNSSCIDIDECSFELHNCESKQNCINTFGSFVCTCSEGYVFDAVTSKCLDFDECLLLNGNCSHTCTNLPGSYQCSCPERQILSEDKRTCVFINECDMNNGGCSHECKFLEGFITCHCPKGYKLDSSQKNCVDINECDFNNGGCSHLCENHLGHFNCLCPLGYKLSNDMLTCTDIDECFDNNGNCSNICINLLGSYSCACDPGYQLQRDLHTCADVNECASMLHECSQICINTEGSYSCECHPGYRLMHNKSCEDINECEITFNGGCSGRCINTVGSFHCECPPDKILSSDNRTCIDIDGDNNIHKDIFHKDLKNRIESQRICPSGYKLAADQVKCVDANECEQFGDNGGCSHLCENLQGSFVCKCPDGFELTEDQRTCQDVDECKIHNGGCSDYCINYHGGFKCECRAGYVLNNDEKSCSPIDFCSSRNGGCDQKCTSDSAGPKCSCYAGFALDPLTNKTCHDIDECQEKNICPQLCINSVGSYECVCNPGFVKNAQGQCEDVNECEYSNGGCLLPAKCINLPGNFKCACPPGYKLSNDKKSCLVYNPKELKDNCLPLKPPKNGEMHCTRSRHKTQLYYRSKCTVWCHKGYKLQGPSVRQCNGSGSWDNNENFCVPQSCPPLAKPIYGTILPPKCLTGDVFPGERCLLHCQPGYMPGDKKASICNFDQTWSTNSSFLCVPAITGRTAVTKPFIKCPRDTIIILPKEQTSIKIRLEQPKTNVDFNKYVDSYPAWAKRLEAELGLGEHIIRFRARSPNSHLIEMCRTVITIKEPNPPQILYCPTSFDMQLNFGEKVKSVIWKEPLFHSDDHIKQIFKSNVPGDKFGLGLHKVVYIATDRNGESSRCEFTINIKNDQSNLSPYSIDPFLAYTVNRLESHETYLMCPGKPAIKVEANFPLHVPAECYIKNMRVNPFLHEHRRRHQRLFNDKLLRYYSLWNDPSFERKINSLYSRRWV